MAGIIEFNTRHSVDQAAAEMIRIAGNVALLNFHTTKQHTALPCCDILFIPALKAQSIFVKN